MEINEESEIKGRAFGKTKEQMDWTNAKELDVKLDSTKSLEREYRLIELLNELDNMKNIKQSEKRMNELQSQNKNGKLGQFQLDLKLKTDQFDEMGKNQIELFKVQQQLEEKDKINEQLQKKIDEMQNEINRLKQSTSQKNEEE